jgi:ankyrin repeat protein
MQKLFILLTVISCAQDTNAATSLVRRAARYALINPIARTIAKPATWVASTRFYKKHPWLVKGAAIVTAGVVLTNARSCYTEYYWKRKTRLITAVLSKKDGRLERVQELLRQGVPVNSQDRDGYTALYWAYWCDHQTIIQALHQAQANPNIAAKNGITPLLLVAGSGHLSAVKQLLQHGADINKQDKNGDTALILATRGRHVQVVQELLRSNALVNTQNKYGDTALTTVAHLLSTKEHVSDYERKVRGDIVKLLIDANANFNIQNKDGETALMLAAQNELTAVMELLLTHKADVDRQNDSGHTALTLAAYYGYQKGVELLLQAKANIHIKTFNDETALQVAQRRQSGPDQANRVPEYNMIIKMLIDAGAQDA